MKSPPPIFTPFHHISSLRESIKEFDSKIAEVCCQLPGYFLNLLNHLSNGAELSPTARLFLNSRADRMERGAVHPIVELTDP